MVLQEVISVPDSAGTKGREKNEDLSPVEEARPPTTARPYHSRVAYPQRLAWSELCQLEPRFERFLEILHRIYASSPCWKLSRVPLHNFNFCASSYLRRAHLGKLL